MPRTRKYQTNAERQAAYRRSRTQQQDAAPIPSVPGQRRWKAMVKVAAAHLDCAVSEIQGYFDQHSEAWQESQAGESLAEMLESMQDALATLDDIVPKGRQDGLL